MKRLDPFRHLILALPMLFTGLLCTPAQASDWSCLGSAIPLSTETNSPYTQLTYAFQPGTNPTPGWFLIDTGSSLSHFDISTVAAAVDGTRPLPLELDFFNSTTFPRFTWSDFSQFILPFQQIGIIGTNVLAQNLYAVDFTNAQLHQNNFYDGCTADQLTANGFAPLSTAGYFSDRVKNLFLLDHIRPSLPNPKKLAVPNVPTIQVKIGSAQAVAQIDSGFDDNKHPFSVNMNEAFLAAVNADKPRLVLATDIKPLSLKTCVINATDTTTAYRLAPGETFDWLTTDGSPARSYTNALFLLKQTPPEALPCGGISTWEIPAAQLGVSFLQDMGMMIFNAHTQTVWVPLLRP